MADRGESRGSRFQCPKGHWLSTDVVGSEGTFECAECNAAPPQDPAGPTDHCRKCGRKLLYWEEKRTFAAHYIKCGRKLLYWEEKGGICAMCAPAGREPEQAKPLHSCPDCGTVSRDELRPCGSQIFYTGGSLTCQKQQGDNDLHSYVPDCAAPPAEAAPDTEHGMSTEELGRALPAFFKPAPAEAAESQPAAPTARELEVLTDLFDDIAWLERQRWGRSKLPDPIQDKLRGMMARVGARISELERSHQ